MSLWMRPLIPRVSGSRPRFFNNPSRILSASSRSPGFLRCCFLQFPFFKIVTNSTNQRDIKRKRAGVSENWNRGERLCRVANPEFVKDVCVGEREIGHDKLREQQSREHCAVNDPSGSLFIAAQRLQSALLNRRFDRLVVGL